MLLARCALEADVKIKSDSMQLTIDGVSFSGLKSVQWDP